MLKYKLETCREAFRAASRAPLVVGSIRSLPWIELDSLQICHVLWGESREVTMVWDRELAVAMQLWGLKM